VSCIFPESSWSFSKHQHRLQVYEKEMKEKFSNHLVNHEAS